MIVAAHNLCEVDTTSGVYRFLIGADGVFTDVSGVNWYGSSLLSMGQMTAAINGVAPGGAIQINYFQDPNAPDIITDMRAKGVAYILDRPIRFYRQHFRSIAEMYAPVTAPILRFTRTMKGMTFGSSGPHERSIEVTFEAWTEDRRAARRIIMDQNGHSEILGRANPSLEFMPTDSFDEERLF